MAIVTAEIIFSNIQRLLIETVNSGASWSSGLWTQAETVGYLQQRILKFLKETGILYSYADMPKLAGVSRTVLPGDLIYTQRVSWKTSSTSYKEIPKADGLEADLLIPTWPNTSSTVPKVYTDGETPTITVQLMPPPANNGNLIVMYVGWDRVRINGRFRIDEFARYPDANIQPWDRTRFTSVGFDSSLGYRIGLPAEMMEGIQWGVIADMLRQIGRPEDMERADYSEQRYEEYKEATKIMLSGWAS